MQFRAHIAPSGSPRSTPLLSLPPKRHHDAEAGWRPFLLLSAITFITCTSVYVALSPLFSHSNDLYALAARSVRREEQAPVCCRGTSHQELWGKVVKAGIGHVFNSSEECCNACKAMCSKDGPCLCNSWVFCEDRRMCKDKFGECWLKMQDDPLVPDVQDSKRDVMWTSGLLYGKDIGIVALETEYGSIRIKLLPEYAPVSVAYLLELLKLRHCAGCHFYRAEGRGGIWDVMGDRVNQSYAGPPYALVQGSLEVEAMPFKEIPNEACLSITRGSVGWIEGGPDFFISLANHEEWHHKYTVFAQVLPADMQLVEKLVDLPTTTSVWNGVRVSVLTKFVRLRLKKYSAVKSVEVSNSLTELRES